MRLTPLDIRKHEFSRSFRGYDAEEVDAFLQMLANQWEDLQDENRRREEKIREIDGKLRHYENVEEALQEALQTARESSRTQVQNAEDKAAVMIEKAEVRADEIKREAERERHELKRETAKLSGRRSEIVSRLRAFLMSEMELLARYEGDDPVGFIKLLPAEEHRVRQLSEKLEEDEAPKSGQPVEKPVLHAREIFRQDAFDREDVAEEAAEAESAASFSPDVPLDTASPRETSTANEPEWSAPAQEQNRHDSFVDSSAPEEEPASPEQDSRRDDVITGPGWTATTVVSRPSEQQGPPIEKSPAPGYESEEEHEDEETSARASSEEIEKIRRILSDLE